MILFGGRAGFTCGTSWTKHGCSAGCCWRSASGSRRGRCSTWSIRRDEASDGTTPRPTQRQPLAQIGVAALAVPTATAVAAEQAAQTPLKVVVTGGHPDDPESGCGGTMASSMRMRGVQQRRALPHARRRGHSRRGRASGGRGHSDGRGRAGVCDPEGPAGLRGADRWGGRRGECGCSTPSFGS